MMHSKSTRNCCPCNQLLPPITTIQPQSFKVVTNFTSLTLKVEAALESMFEHQDDALSVPFGFISNPKDCTPIEPPPQILSFQMDLPQAPAQCCDYFHDTNPPVIAPQTYTPCFMEHNPDLDALGLDINV